MRGPALEARIPKTLPAPGVQGELNSWAKFRRTRLNSREDGGLFNSERAA